MLSAHEVTTAYQGLVAISSVSIEVAKGEIVFRTVQDEVLIYTREFEGEAILCVFNMSATEGEASLPDGNWQALSGHGFTSNNYGSKIDIPAWGAYFARLA